MLEHQHEGLAVTAGPDVHTILDKALTHESSPHLLGISHDRIVVLGLPDCGVAKRSSDHHDHVWVGLRGSAGRALATVAAVGVTTGADGAAHITPAKARILMV